MYPCIITHERFPRFEDFVITFRGYAHFPSKTQHLIIPPLVSVGLKPSVAFEMEVIDTVTLRGRPYYLIGRKVVMRPAQFYELEKVVETVALSAMGAAMVFFIEGVNTGYPLLFPIAAAFVFFAVNCASQKKDRDPHRFLERRREALSNKFSVNILSYGLDISDILTPQEIRKQCLEEFASNPDFGVVQKFLDNVPCLKIVLTPQEFQHLQSLITRSLELERTERENVKTLQIELQQRLQASNLKQDVVEKAMGFFERKKGWEDWKNKNQAILVQGFKEHCGQMLKEGVAKDVLIREDSGKDGRLLEIELYRQRIIQPQVIIPQQKHNKDICILRHPAYVVASLDIVARSS